MSNPITREAISDAIIQKNHHLFTTTDTLISHFNIAAVLRDNLEAQNVSRLADEIDKFAKNIKNIYGEADTPGPMNDKPIFSLISNKEVYNTIVYGNKAGSQQQTKTNQQRQTQAVYFVETMIMRLVEIVMMQLAEEGTTSPQELEKQAKKELITSPESFFSYIDKNVGWLQYLRDYSKEESLKRCINEMVKAAPSEAPPLMHAILMASYEVIPQEDDFTRKMQCYDMTALIHAASQYIPKQEQLANMSLSDVQTSSDEAISDIMEQIVENASIEEQPAQSLINDIGATTKAHIRELQLDISNQKAIDMVGKHIIRPVIKKMSKPHLLLEIHLMIEALTHVAQPDAIERIYHDEEEQQQIVQAIIDKDLETIRAISQAQI